MCPARILRTSEEDIMAAPRTLQFDTLSLHAGQRHDPVTGARATPIYFTTSFVFRDADHAAALFNMERSGHVYSRISNPTNAVLEERVAALEGGVGAVATASGQAALHLAVATIAGAGSHLVASRALYGGSHNLLSYTLPRFGIATSLPGERRFARTRGCSSARHSATRDWRSSTFPRSPPSRTRRNCRCSSIRPSRRRIC